MSTAYAWPAAWVPRRFELRLQPNVITFTSPLNRSTQAVDLLGERWRIVLDLPPDVDSVRAGALEAFFDRLKGPTNFVTIGHTRLRAPQGTMRGAPTLSAAAAQLANTVAIGGTSGTLLAGDMLGIGGQLCRVMANATVPGSVEIAPRLRTAMSSGTAVVWDYPTANFRLVGDGAPVAWSPGMHDAPSIELVEAI